MQLICQLPSHAGGLQALPSQARGAALGAATVALASESEGFSRNPALLGTSKGTRLTLGAGLMVPEYRFAGITPSEAETKSKPVFLFPPSFALSFRINEEIGLGLSAGAPFLTRSEWDPAWVGRQLSTYCEHRTGALTPAIAFSPVRGLSLGVSIPLMLTKHVMTSWLFDPGPVASAGQAYQRNVQGESGVELGFQAGVLLEEGSWTVGGAYTVGTSVTISDAEASLNTTAQQPLRESYSGRQASISMNLPAELAIGATINPVPALLLTTEFDLVMWSSADRIEYDIPGTPDGYVIPQNWDNSYRIAFGVEYRLSALDLRTGFSYDVSPVPDATVHPAFADADRYGYSVGLGYRVGPGLVFDFGIAGSAFKDRRVDASALTITDEATGEPSQPFNGTYRTAGTNIVLSVSYLWR